MRRTVLDCGSSSLAEKGIKWPPEGGCKPPPGGVGKPPPEGGGKPPPGGVGKPPPGGIGKLPPGGDSVFSFTSVRCKPIFLSFFHFWWTFLLCSFTRSSELKFLLHTTQATVFWRCPSMCLLSRYLLVKGLPQRWHTCFFSKLPCTVLIWLRRFFWFLNFVSHIWQEIFSFWFGGAWVARWAFSSVFS